MWAQFIFLSNRQSFRMFVSKNLFSQLGINYLDMDLLLGYSENENIPGWRESIIKELGQYLASTGRLFSRVAGEDVPQ